MEKSLLTVAGWKYEGVSWKTSSEGNPIYRVYHPQSGEHLYTVNGNEKNLLVAQGWRDKGIFGKSGSKEKSAPIYRLYNPNAPQVSSHHYTMSGGERQYLIKKGWRDEGIAFYQEAFSQSFDQGLPQPLIIDISGYQDPKLINYDALQTQLMRRLFVYNMVQLSKILRMRRNSIQVRINIIKHILPSYASEGCRLRCMLLLKRQI